MLFFVSEAAYVINHPSALSAYTLKTARIISATDRTDIAFFILTKGKLELPSDQNYKTIVKNYLSSVPPKYDLPRVYYDLALISYANGQENLTPKLLESSINLDPGFSFWYVELANYYLSRGQVEIGRKVLDDCIAIDAPRKHCQDYLNSSFNNNQPESTGFLKESINKFYETRDH